MDRRAFLVFTLAGFSPPESTLVQLAQGTGAPVAYASPSDGLTPSGDVQFDTWRADFVQRQAAAGWDGGFLRQHLGGLAPDPRVVAADSRQPEFSKPISDYLRGAVSTDRIENGRAKLAGAGGWLPQVSARTGVDSEILVAIWGMESAFGAVQGEMDVVRSLATLAAEGRRRAWAEGQLLAALRMIRDGYASRPMLRGSWAGAMGQTQFMPDTFLALAVDGDGDGRRDIWGSAPDALASAANLLARQGGWKAGQSWAREVVLPREFDYALAEGPRQSPAAWQALGVRTADGYGFSAADASSEAGLITPMGYRGPAFLVFPNHFAIRRYNNSTSYALGVGMLADAIAGRQGLVAAWPADQPSTLADRRGAQAALQQMGFDPGEPDGIIGVNTRSAVRAYQQQRGLIPDGYLSNDLMRKLIAEAAGAAPVSGSARAATGN